MKQPVVQMKRLLAASALAAGLFFLAVPVTDAQQGGRRPRVIQLDEIRIEGRVQKPNAFYILNRSNLGYEVMDLRTSFVREVVRSVQRDPF
jgi:hypothetical protein